MSIPRPEVWQRGPVPDVPALLQPVAHAILQAREELEAALLDFPDERLWDRPAGVASVGFHLQHMPGVQDRMITYARGLALSEAQFAAKQAEGHDAEAGQPPITTAGLLAAFSAQVDATVRALAEFDPETLTAARTLGRAALPTTVLGLLFHAAEHTMRHVGQLLVTIRVVTSR